MTAPQITLHGATLSGHAHRVQLLLRALDIPYRFVETPGAARQSEGFLRLNPLGQIPVLEDGAAVVADSNAILVYLVRRYAPGSHWLPQEPLAASEVQRWLSLAAGELRFGPAAARAIRLWGAPGDPSYAAAIAERLLRFMESHLATRSYLVTDQTTIADLACHTYTAHAPEGGISLEPYAAIRRWLARIEALPWFVAMPPSLPPAGLRA